MKKRILAICLALVMVLSLSACGAKGGAKKNEITLTKWVGLFNGTELTFSEDGTGMYGANAGTWEESESGEIKITYTNHNVYLGDTEVTEIIEKLDTEDGTVLKFQGDEYYPEDKVNEIRKSKAINIGDVVSTDIINITLKNAELGIYANAPLTSTSDHSTTNIDEAYSPTYDSSTIFSAAKGRSLLCFQFVVENNDRDSLNSSDNVFDFKVLYGDEIYNVNGYDLNDKDGDTFGMNYYYSSISQYGGKFITNDATNILMYAGEKDEVKTLGVVGFEPASYDEPFYVIVQMKNSSDEYESFIYSVE